MRLELETTRNCCLGPFGKRFRDILAPTQESWDSGDAQRALLMWERVQRLSTAPVEREHKTLKDDIHSASIGLARGTLPTIRL